MITVKLTPANGQAKEEVPDLAAVMAKLDRVAVRAEHTVACEYVHAAHRLVYAMQWHCDDITDAVRRDWLYAAVLLTPPPGEVW